MSDTDEITELLTTFFSAFVSGDDISSEMTALRAALLPNAVIVKTCGSTVSYTVDEFIAPREAILTDGTLTDFREWPSSGRLDIFGDIAQWFGSYRKSGAQGGAAFTGAGMKSVQFVRTSDGWRISAAIWDDERPTVSLNEYTEKTWPA